MVWIWNASASLSAKPVQSWQRFRDLRRHSRIQHVYARARKSQYQVLLISSTCLPRPVRLLRFKQHALGLFDRIDDLFGRQFGGRKDASARQNQRRSTDQTYNQPPHEPSHRLVPRIGIAKFQLQPRAQPSGIDARTKKSACRNWTIDPAASAGRSLNSNLGRVVRKTPVCRRIRVLSRT